MDTLNTEDIVRVIRVLEYVGPRSWMERQIAGSIHGTRVIDSQRSITAVTLHEFPQIIRSNSD